MERGPTVPGRVTREERCSFPVGTDRPPRRNGPARPSAAGSSRSPDHSRPVPFLPGRLAKCDTPCRSKHNSYVSGVHVPYIRKYVSRFPSLLSRWTLGLCTVHFAPHRVCPHAALHHPPVHQALRLQQRCALRTHACLGTPPSRVLPVTVVYRLLHGPSRRLSLRPSADLFSRLRLLSDSRSHEPGLPHPPISRGVRACPDHRRQQPQSQLFLLLTAR